MFRSRNRRSRSFSPTIELLEGRALLAADPLTVIIGSGAAKSVQFTDATGTQAMVFLTGAGTANVNFDGTGLSQSANAKGLVVNGSDISLSSIAVNLTNAQSALQITTVKKHALSVGSISVAGAINALLAPSVTVAGDVSSGGGLHVLQLAGAHDGTITIGSGHGVGTLGVQIGSVSDESLNAAIPITTLFASQWVNTVGEDLTITAPQINAISIAHDFTADVTTGSIGTMNVRGTVASSTLNLTTPLTIGKSLTLMNVAGAIASTTISAGGNIGSITAGRLSDSFIYAGLVANPSGAFPSATTDFRNTASIGSVSLKKSASASFSNSVIAAYNINSANLGTVSQSNGGTAFGLAAHDVKSVTIKDLATGKVIHAANPPTTTTFDDILVSKGVTPEDFEVRIV